MKIQLRDEVREFPNGMSAIDIFKELSPGLGRAAVAAKVDGELVDLRTVLDKDCELLAITMREEEGKKAYWHTAAHILAQAVKRLYPVAKLAIGPAIDSGFYYDFDVEKPFSPEDFSKIEAEMKKIVKENLAIERFELPRAEALKLMADQGAIYKVELIEDLPEDSVISFYRQGDFTDLCAGPHLMSTGAQKYQFKLLSNAGAYWRGSEKNKMLQRIYAIAFPKKQELDEHLERLEEAKKRDHRKLGQELDLFSFHEEGPGFPFFHPKGMILQNILADYWRKIHTEWGYDEVKTPIMLNKDLWIRSGHWDHYRENMYTSEIDETEFAIKPMNCPGGMILYKRRKWSYRDLPQRVGELGLVHRHELSGALHGLMRVRNFTQDDAHIFMTPDQIKDEIVGVIELTTKVYEVFGFKYNLELSTRPEGSIGSDEEWEMATNALQAALEEKNMSYVINEGDGAFYGPKIDFHLEDSIGRTWQCGTIQLDFQLPQRFDLTYVDRDDKARRPVTIHRVVYGSLERFMGILIEHFAGAFPLWISPEQVRILAITNRNDDYIKELETEMKRRGVRVKSDLRNEKLGYKIREARLEKVPYILVVGDNEMANDQVSVRRRGEGDIGVMDAGEFINMVCNEDAEKVIF